MLNLLGPLHLHRVTDYRVGLQRGKHTQISTRIINFKEGTFLGGSPQIYLKRFYHISRSGERNCSVRDMGEGIGRESSWGRDVSGARMEALKSTQVEDEERRMQAIVRVFKWKTRDKIL